MRLITTGLVLALCGASSLGAQSPPPRGIVLADLTWVEAERVLTPEALVVIPLGAQAKEHGPHLRLDNDFQLAEYYRARVLAASEVIVAPTVNYHFYPSFLEYPGSTHLQFETAKNVILDIVRSLAAYGPRRFYVLNTGVSTARPLNAAAEILRAEGIHFAFTLVGAGPEETRIREQVRGTHADEMETSMMLYMRPDRVDMSKAVRDDSEQGQGGLTRVRGNGKTYSPSGVWGDATLATREKGRIVVEETVAQILAEIEALRAEGRP